MHYLYNPVSLLLNMFCESVISFLSLSYFISTSPPICLSISLIVQLANIIIVTMSVCINCNAHFLDDI